MLKNKLVLVKGAGDFASGSIRRLHLAGAKVVCTELPQPLTIRRAVAFSEAMYQIEQTVEGVTAVRSTSEEIDNNFSEGKIPILDDPEGAILNHRKFDIVIDGRMAKRNLGTKLTDAPIVIGLGPGFEAGADCHAVVETLAGHNLGRVVYKGSATKDTGIPIPTELFLNPCCATIPEPCCAGFNVDSLILRAPGDGVFFSIKQIGDIVKKDDIIGKVEGYVIKATVDGVLRGLIHDDVRVTKGLKIGDIDPSGDISRVNQISEKSNAIAGGVLEACLYLLNKDL
ncbi:selenium-dependent molybdenum cofactor biosynthesis protein YqeB [[Eubacterium] cellulosolvens]